MTPAGHLPPSLSGSWTPRGGRRARRRPARPWSAALVVGLLFLTATASPVGAGPALLAVVTTADRSALLAPLAITRTSARTPADVRLTLRPDQRHQQVLGAGGSLTEASAQVLTSSTADVRDAVMQDLFGPAGAGLTVLRQPLGGSEFVAGTFYTLDDLPPGQSDPTLRHLDIDRDRAGVIPLVLKANELAGGLTVIASPWSPPAWMKTNLSLVGGRLRATPQMERTYARYLAAAVHAYHTAGVDIDLITVQNEPGYSPLNYPGSVMNPWQQARIIRHLAPLLAEVEPGTGILGYDHNWSDGERFLDALLGSSAAPLLAGVAYHCYQGRPASIAGRASLRGGTPYLTECSGSAATLDGPDERFADTLRWQGRHALIESLAAGSATVVTWNLVLDPAGGPHRGGCDTCSPVITVDPETGETSRNAEFYVLAHLGRYTDAGAVRIGVEQSGAHVRSVALQNPDGGIVVLAQTDSTGPRSVSVTVGERSYGFTIPADGLATAVLPG